MHVKQLRCYNAGEHQTKLLRACERNGVNMKYAPPYTPQMNGVVERRIASTNRSTFTMWKGWKFGFVLTQPQR
jgi:transposase InsO family protein